MAPGANSGRCALWHDRMGTLDFSSPRISADRSLILAIHLPDTFASGGTLGCARMVHIPQSNSGPRTAEEARC